MAHTACCNRSGIAHTLPIRYIAIHTMPAQMMAMTATHSTPMMMSIIGHLLVAEQPSDDFTLGMHPQLQHHRTQMAFSGAFANADHAGNLLVTRARPSRQYR